MNISEEDLEQAYRAGFEYGIEISDNYLSSSEIDNEIGEGWSKFLYVVFNKETT